MPARQLTELVLGDISVKVAFSKDIMVLVRSQMFATILLPYLDKNVLKFCNPVVINLDHHV